MDLEKTLQRFKHVAPDPAFSEKSKRAILATMPKEPWSAWRSLAHVLEAGVGVALATFFIFVITGQLSGTPYVAPVKFSVINPAALQAEAQAVDIQIQLAEVAYETPTSTVNETTVQAPTGTAAASGFVPAELRAAELAATSSVVATADNTAGVSGTSTATSTAVVSVDQALVALSGVAPSAEVAVSGDTCATISASDLATLTTAQELTQELTLRKQLLGEAITCATDDATVLQTTVNTVTLPGDNGLEIGVNDAAIQNQLSGKLDDAANFYAIESAKINGAGISGTAAIAREMIAWRAANYIPLAGDINNFGLWATNQSLFETAQDRITQTGHVVSFIEGITTTNGDLETGLQAAQTSLTSALGVNASAGAALGQGQPSDQTLALIQQSLQSLADTYQKFSGLNGLIQALLPTTSN